MHECLSTHSDCQKNVNQTLPTRVLNIGSCDGSREPYLLEANNITSRYATLSYCWGGSVSLTTRSDNILAHKQGIPFSSMPPTFRHAVQISRRLGIQYLWIDSLCILQDSKRDWEQESSKMGDIYEGSYVTIAARSASSPDVGCFFTRRKSLSCQLDYRSVDGSVVGYLYFRDPAFPVEQLMETPLDKRGWVLQERILPPRVVYYGAQQIYWECRQVHLRQDGKYEERGRTRSSNTILKRAQDTYTAFKSVFGGFYGPSQPEWTEKQMELAVRMLQWSHVVQEFSRRNLSFDSDKLPAIAGIAKAFARSTGYSYVAGLWREDIVPGLLWYRRTGDKGPLISQKLPSWTWARFNGEVTFWNGRDLMMVSDYSCDFMDISYTPSGRLGPYGEVSDARLKLHGIMIVVQCKKDENGIRLYHFEGKEIGYANLDVDDFKFEDRRLSCLLLQGNKNGVSAGLLIDSVGGQHDTYKRVGYSNINCDGPWECPTLSTNSGKLSAP